MHIATFRRVLRRISRGVLTERSGASPTTFPFLPCLASCFVTEANIACDDTTFVSSTVSKHTTEEKWPQLTYHSIVYTACIQMDFNVVAYSTLIFLEWSIYVYIRLTHHIQQSWPTSSTWAEPHLLVDIGVKSKVGRRRRRQPGKGNLEGQGGKWARRHGHLLR